ncbi:MAG: alpha/beta hydrolase [Alphaproteobacteria bacterium]|nr:alpha/beta hydrolase [Alphaproteobacteria bacterium]
MNEDSASSGSILCETPANPIPDGARAGFFLTSDKVKLRYAIWPKSAGAMKGTICLVQGRAEPMEKYFETIGDFRKRGFCVAIFDWRGQGGSQRLVKSQHLGYVDTFEDYWTDLKSFHADILLPDCPPPFYLVGHSMGGLVALMAAVRDRLMFERLFLTAPMLAIPGQPLSMSGMAVAAEALSFAGFGQFAIGRAGDGPPSETRFPGNPLTSDFRRFMYLVDAVKARPSLLIGKPSIKWLAAAFRAMARVAHHDFAGRVRVPVLMLAAARDEIVSVSAIEHLGLALRTGRHAVIAAARHELFMESDAIRAQVFAAFDAFITEKTE